MGMGMWVEATRILPDGGAAAEAERDTDESLKSRAAAVVASAGLPGLGRTVRTCAQKSCSSEAQTWSACVSVPRLGPGAASK
jgi:hypothetical protein